jgi:hypothetical protein
MRRVFSSFDLVAVHHAKNVLQAAGIAAVVRNEFLSSAMGELPPAECQGELWVVNDADAPRAEALLRMPPRRGAPWHCQQCGERSDPQFTHCWQCGAAAANDANA